MSTTKWKIQLHSVNGWGDLKMSIGGEPYLDDHYDSLNDALVEMQRLILSNESNDGTESRAVKATVPQDYDLYD